MEIREMPLEQLHTADYNPRVALEPGDPEFERLKNSIETFGEVAPIVWNQRTGRIVGGHQRLAVYKHLGRQTATVSVVDLDEKEEKLLNVALNKIKGQWDYSKLEQLLGDGILRAGNRAHSCPERRPRGRRRGIRRRARRLRRRVVGNHPRI